MSPSSIGYCFFFFFFYAFLFFSYRSVVYVMTDGRHTLWPSRRGFPFHTSILALGDGCSIRSAASLDPTAIKSSAMLSFWTWPDRIPYTDRPYFYYTSLDVEIILLFYRNKYHRKHLF